MTLEEIKQAGKNGKTIYNTRTGHIYEVTSESRWNSSEKIWELNGQSKVERIRLHEQTDLSEFAVFELEKLPPEVKAMYHLIRRQMSNGLAGVKREWRA